MAWLFLLQLLKASLVWLLCVEFGESKPLLLTPLIQAGEFQKAREVSKVFIDGTSMGHSGFLAVPSASGKRTNQLFVWFQPCLDGCDASTTPLIQWFNGGPGSPDTVGAMNQIGNWYVDKDLTLHERCFSWCRKYNCLFVDSPVMTGFSYQEGVDMKEVEYTKTSQDATRQVLGALTQFLQIWPEYAFAPYYVQGLSYGGHYVPWMARQVLAHNAQAGQKQQINIKGIAVGDPAMDNKYQYPTYATTLYSMGLLLEDERATVETLMDKARDLNDVNCSQSFQVWNKVFNDDGGSSCYPNCEFLFQKFTGSSNTEHLLLGAQPESMGHFRKWLAKHAKELHVDGRPYTNSSLSEGGKVYSAMVDSGDNCQSTAALYAELYVQFGLDVIIYSSNLDPLLGPPSTAAGIQAVWDYAEKHLKGGADSKAKFYVQRKSIWRVEQNDEDPAGYARCLNDDSKRFCYVIVRNAGHETTSYAPRASHDLNERFLHRLPFDSEKHEVCVPKCAECGGAPPLAGDALPSCSKRGSGQVTSVAATAAATLPLAATAAAATAATAATAAATLPEQSQFYS
eukprot:TRINITY_DN4686_c0_g1_i1.p1 TRINITY_DN4686_c0_g1~~TRINITY_DN4686_c0_g1_i1.p1  ORF type:complete len:590 (+),score=94.94 TRINITY_DN4686_c0_g1_i1:69-1772(+)